MGGGKCGLGVSQAVNHTKKMPGTVPAIRAISGDFFFFLFSISFLLLAVNFILSNCSHSALQ